MIVMKFGGTSVAGKNEISRAVEIIASRLNKKPVVVVSAMSKVTDLLYKLAEAAASKQTDLCEELLSTLCQFFFTCFDLCNLLICKSICICFFK